MNHSLRTRTVAGLVAFVAVATLVTACSSSDSKSAEAKYCESWQKVADAFSTISDISLTASGVEGLDTSVQKVSDAVASLVASADSMLKPKVEAFQSSLTDLADAVTTPSVDYLDNIDKASSKVDTSWNDLVTTAKTSCPDVKASKV